MKLIIVGSGRMGIRHATGASNLDELSEIMMVDISNEALENAKDELSKLPCSEKINYRLLNNQGEVSKNYDIAIIASTASNRIETVKFVYETGCKYLMIEKPLGQSMSEVEELNSYVKDLGIDTCVNLNMRLYDSFIQLRKDLNEKPQLTGEKVITVNTGTIGIGANGIHYLDLLYFILNAKKAKIVAGEIEENLIQSGRGQGFADYGGWCTIKFYNSNDEYIGRSHLSISSNSSVFGGWDIVSGNGRIIINEMEQKRTDILRKADSNLPVYRYAADYNQPVEYKFISPPLSDLTEKWLNGLLNEKQLLPSIEESIKVHRLMFDWLEMNVEKKKHFSIA